MPLFQKQHHLILLKILYFQLIHVQKLVGFITFCPRGTKVAIGRPGASRIIKKALHLVRLLPRAPQMCTLAPKMLKDHICVQKCIFDAKVLPRSHSCVSERFGRKSRLNSSVITVSNALWQKVENFEVFKKFHFHKKSLFEKVSFHRSTGHI